MSLNDPQRRRDRIVTLLSTFGELSAQAMSDRLGVTVQTLRADLRALDEAQVVRRRHGGARLVSASENISYQPRQAVSASEKARIGAAVAGIVTEGASLALGTGTTVEAVARALTGHAGLTVATNNLHAVLALQTAPDVTVFVAGGKVRMRDLDFIGAESTEFFGSMRMDYAVFSVGGLTADGALADFNLDEIRARKAVGGAGTQTVLVLDHAKIGRSAPHLWGALRDVDIVVCGAPLPAALADLAARGGTRVIIA